MQFCCLFLETFNQGPHLPRGTLLREPHQGLRSFRSIETNNTCFFKGSSLDLSDYIMMIHPVQTPYTLLLIGVCFTSQINKNIHDIHIRYGMKVLRNSHAIVAEDCEYTHEKETTKSLPPSFTRLPWSSLRRWSEACSADRNNWPSVFQRPVAIPFPEYSRGLFTQKRWGT